MRRRRYQSLGLMKRSHTRPGGGGPLEGVEKFVSESHVNDIILYNRVTRARPGIRQLEFPDDDVDWQLEYFCGEIGKWVMRLLAWLLGIFESFMRFLGFRRKKNNYENDAGGGNGKGDGRERKLLLNTLDHSRGDERFSQANTRITQLYPDVIWRFENCIPFLKRRILKRKWFLNPRTKEWADDKVELFRKHVTRGFRTLCSGVGKDTKIYVVCSSAEVATTSSSLSPSSSPQTYIFRADSRVLQTHSMLFREWFSSSENEKKIVTTFVTPQEMQAILVYMYTLTWPTDMILPKGGKRITLDPRFLQVLEMHGMSLDLDEETPPLELRRRSNLLATLVEEPPGKDENQNVVVVDENSRTFLKPVTSSSNFVRHTTSMADGQGDCSQCLQESEILQFITEKDPPLVSAKDVAEASSEPASPSLDRSLNVSKFVRVRDSLKVSFSSNHHRVHPETNLTPDQLDRLRIRKNQTTSFVTSSVDTGPDQNSWSEE